jgi:hypothetical protein
LPRTQSLSLVHVVRHAVAPQTNGAQFWTTPAGHALDWPLHLAASVCWPLAHDGGAHTLELSKPLGGQPALTPSQTSSTSHTPTASRHFTPALPGGAMQPWFWSQLSTVHGSPSLQTGAGPPTQALFAHVSFVVQALLSLHGFVLAAKTQPVAVLQESSVQAFESSHVIVVPVHAPAWQRSALVQALPSLHVFVSSFVYVQPEMGLHASSVHALLSLQTSGVPPTHTLFEQASFVVHASLSLQGSVFAVKVQPVAGTHASVVHTLLSLQVTVPVGEQAPARQRSPLVQALPSLHAFALLFTCVQPVAGEHASSVQGLLSLQFGAAPPTHAPAPLQASFVVQALLSLQAMVFGVLIQAPWALQLSVVQGLLSLQAPAVPAHVPLLHVSFVVHELPSLHGFPESGWVMHWSVVSLHDALLHWLPKLEQSRGVPPPQTPNPLQVSLTVQKRPSLHDVPFWSGAVQLSFVSLQLSLQFGPVFWPVHGLPACCVQAPVTQVSGPLQ